MGCSLAISAIGPFVFTAIVLFGLAQQSEFWPLLPIAVVSWTGVVLALKWKLTAGIVQVIISGALPSLFWVIGFAIDPQGDLGVFLGLVIIIPSCTVPLLISGIILIISWIRER